MRELEDVGEQPRRRGGGEGGKLMQSCAGAGCVLITSICGRSLDMHQKRVRRRAENLYKIGSYPIKMKVRGSDMNTDFLLHLILTKT